MIRCVTEDMAPPCTFFIYQESSEVINRAKSEAAEILNIV